MECVGFLQRRVEGGGLGFLGNIILPYMGSKWLDFGHIQQH